MSPSADTPVDFTARTPVKGDLDVQWIHGSRGRGAAPAPPIQVHAYDEHTIILRQSKSVHFEAPFMFLLFGNHCAMLIDTGATPEPARFPLRATVDRLIESWLAAHPRSTYALVVAHTHGHNDHVAADVQFAGRPDTTIVGHDPEAVRSFFGFGEAWPAEQVGYDLGGRVLQIIGATGHQEAAIVLHDPYTGILLTGDTVMPGRLYARDFPVFADTVERLAAFAEAHPVTHVLGCHVEMTNRPRQDYPLGARYQPDERPLPMTVAQLAAVRDAVGQAATRTGVHVFDDFVVYHLPSRAATIRLLWRGMVSRILPRR
jgi:glyoxylase-like metal-dependent hydrolase (beta-lactamase superfamily II)